MDDINIKNNMLDEIKNLTWGIKLLEDKIESLERLLEMEENIVQLQTQQNILLELKIKTLEKKFMITPI
jgi:hypothetical protein